MTAGLDSVLEGFRPVGLDELDERAALLHRVDNKYVVEWDAFASLCEQLRADHEVLEIDGRRSFEYETVYFDTADLRCYRDHEEGRVPRFKARTRLYRNSDRCVFEVKLKVGSDETDKRQIEYPPASRAEITDRAHDFLTQTLRESGLELRDELEPSLRTSFRRTTIAAAARADRLTCDVDLTLTRENAEARLDPGLVVLESKSEHGESPADAALADLGAERISLSKYRAGIELLTDQNATGNLLDAVSYFRTSGERAVKSS